jgi:hypothetical protein
MRLIQTTNVVFRCPEGLKEKMKIYAEANDIQLSAAIRSACSELLKREMPSLFPHLTIPHLTSNEPFQEQKDVA